MTRRQEHQGTTSEQFWDLVERYSDPVRPLWCFCHNAGFDLTVLEFWRKVEDSRFLFRQVERVVTDQDGTSEPKHWNGLVCIEDPPTILKFRLSDRENEVAILDTMNYFRCSVQALGESMGIGKLPLPDYDAPDEVWATYCRRDVEIIERAISGLITLVRNEKMGKFGYTAGGQAMNLFRRQFLSRSRPILIHGDEKAMQMERAAYFGGSVHLGFRGKVIRDKQYFSPEIAYENELPLRLGPVFVLDVQSFYPSLMAEYLYPYRIHQVWKELPLAAIPELQRNFSLIATVGIDAKEPGYPIRKQGQTQIATGRYVTTLCGQELLRAYAKNEVKMIISAVTYYRDSIFRDYVQFLWDLRQRFRLTGDREFEQLAKILMNSLYGKFGQHSHRWHPRKDITAPIPWGYFWDYSSSTKVRQQFRSVGWFVQQLTEKQEHFNSFPAIPAHVTSFGRERMNKLFDLAGRSNVLYSDTDSIHVLEDGYRRLEQSGWIQEGELGKLRLEGIYETAEYRSFKNYKLDAVEVIAGVKSGSERIDETTWQSQKFERMRSIIGRELSATVQVRTELLHQQRFCRIGRVDPDGTVHPIHLTDY